MARNTSSQIDLILNPTRDSPLLLPAAARAERHSNIAAGLPRLTALRRQIIVPDEIRLIGAISTWCTVCDRTVASTGAHREASFVTGAVTSVLAVDAVDERDVVPEGVGDAVLELCDAVGPEAGGVAGDFKRGVAVKALAECGTRGDGGLVVCSSTPSFMLALVIVWGWDDEGDIQDSDIIATAVVDDSLTSQSTAEEGLERDSAEKIAREHLE